jgi:hypothetical protein
MDQTFNVSTGATAMFPGESNAEFSAAGILPLTLHDVGATSWFLHDGERNDDNEIIPGNITSVIEIPDSALSASYSMVQQGELEDRLSILTVYQCINKGSRPA